MALSDVGLPRGVEQVAEVVLLGVAGAGDQPLDLIARKKKVLKYSISSVVTFFQKSSHGEKHKFISFAGAETSLFQTKCLRISMTAASPTPPKKSRDVISKQSFLTVLRRSQH